MSASKKYDYCSDIPISLNFRELLFATERRGHVNGVRTSSNPKIVNLSDSFYLDNKRAHSSDKKNGPQLSDELIRTQSGISSFR